MIPAILPTGETGRGSETISLGGPPTGQMISILVVDDHPLVRDGIATLVSTQSDMRVVAEASSGRQAIEGFKKHHPEITLMDLQMPGINGLDALIAIRH